MRHGARDFLISASQSGATNVLAALVSVGGTLLFPRLLGVTDFSYWQLYVFYIGYVGVLQFGWNDGMYLRYGGRHYDSLDRGVFAGQFRLLIATQLLLGGALAATAAWLAPEPERAFVVGMTGVATLLLGGRSFLLLLCQATNLIARYARILAVESILFIALVTAWVGFGGTGFRALIVCDLIAKGGSFVLAAVWCRDLVLARAPRAEPVLPEAWRSIAVGVKLMLANLSSILMIGVVRFAIERHWSVVVFGKVSLSLSLSNIFMVFVNAVGVVVFPTLRRLDPARKPQLFLAFRCVYMVAALAALLVFFPLRVVLAAWLPDYAETLAYLAVLFPAFVFEGRMALLITSFLKDLRAERSLLLVNAGGVLLAVAAALVTVGWLGDLNLAVGSILGLIVVRTTVAELVLWRILRVSAWAGLLAELAVTAVFVVVAVVVPAWPAAGWYGLAWVCYLLLSGRRLISATRFVRTLVMG